MKQRLRFLVFSLLALLGPSLEAQPLPFENPGFEEDLSGWKVEEKDEPMSSVLPEAAREGQKGLRISDNSETYSARIYSSVIPVEPGKTYRLTYWARTSTPRRVGVFFRFVHPGGKWFADSYRPFSEIDSEDSDWKEYTLEATAPEDAAAVMIWIHSYSKMTGEVDLDDFVIERVEASGPVSGKLEPPVVKPGSAPAAAVVPSAPLVSGGGQSGEPVIILKFDDLRAAQGKRAVAAPWQRLGEFIRERRLKSSIGIICESLENGNEASFEWIKSLKSDGLVEFWFHGWDHMGWLDGEGRAWAEFRNRPYEEQKRRFEMSQRLAIEKLGFPFTTFGPTGFIPPKAPEGAAPVTTTPKAPDFPGDNYGFDAATLRVMQEDPHMKIFLYPTPLTWVYPTLDEAAMRKLEPAEKFTVLDRVWNANIEMPLFVPSLEKFREAYAQNIGKRDYLVLQGHPSKWDDERFAEFVKIIEFLTERGAEFATPSEYVARRNAVAAQP